MGYTVPVNRGTPFFLSYVHSAEVTAGANHDTDQLVADFFRDLSQNIASLISLRVGVSPGFMDRSMRGGMRWGDELLHALGTCQVLIALLSTGYLESVWCAMEWDAFSQRTVHRPEESISPRQGCIIPVIWAPIPAELKLPKKIESEMIFSPETRPDPEVVGQYKENGVLGLKRMQQEAMYQIVVWQLAKHISHVYYGQRTEPKSFMMEELSTTFGG